MTKLGASISGFSEDCGSIEKSGEKRLNWFGHMMRERVYGEATDRYVIARKKKKRNAKN